MIVYYAKVNDPAYECLGGHLDLLFDGEIETNCVNCDKKIKHSKSLYRIVGVCCSRECAENIGYYGGNDIMNMSVNELNENEIEQTIESAPVATVVSPVTIVKESKTCPKCSGPAKGRGYTHVDGCELDKRAGQKLNQDGTTVPARVCSLCNGPARGRGFTHTADCSENSKNKIPDTSDVKPTEPKVVKLCPECSGPAKGRGFTHTDTCSLNCHVKMAAAKGPIRTCSACGGTARGRGFTHTADCSDVLARKAAQEVAALGNEPIVQALESQDAETIN